MSVSFLEKIKDPKRWSRYIRGKADYVASIPLHQKLCWQGWSHQHDQDARYRFQNESDILKSRTSDTLFIFGCGYSLNSLSSAAWDHMSKHQTLGFNWFIRQNFIRCDYFVLREIVPSMHEFSGSTQGDDRIRLFTSLAQGPLFSQTIYAIQSGWRAYVTNRLLASGQMPEGSRFFRYETTARGVRKPPSEQFSEGLVHGVGTLFECLNFAYIMGFKRIVLTGVDLYDQRYFWLPPDQTRPELLARGIGHNDIHPGNQWIINYVKYWKPFFQAKGLELSVANPKSLLAQVLPVYPLP